MYTEFFHLNHLPFSIAPDPRYLYMSERHREALAHLLYGVNSGGGIVVLTGEIGAGKTTVCRCLLEQMPADCNVAYIFNPKLTVNELLQSICEEFRIRIAQSLADTAGVKAYIDRLNEYLLGSNADGKNNVLIIDEAQNLSADVLEQLRLLTNLETSERKLLQIVLIGQPELRAMLDRPELEQLAQRVIARYHLDSLSLQESANYIQHRLSVAGLCGASPFQPKLMQLIYRITQGVPRRINLLCDRALLGAYVENKPAVDRGIVLKAAIEVFGNPRRPQAFNRIEWRRTSIGLVAVAILVAAIGWTAAQGLLEKSGTPARPADVAKLAAPEAEKDKSAATAAGPELAGAASIASRDENAAYFQLARLWNVALDQGEACQAALKSDLHCYRSDGGLAEIRLLDRPVMLALHEDSGKTYYALLVALSDAGASLRIGDATRNVSLASLDRHFKGDFFSFWRAPKAWREKIRKGYRGEDVDWLAAQLAKLNGIAAPSAGHGFNSTMVGMLRKYQESKGLKPDGVAGPKTYMNLNAVAGVDEPRLLANSSASAVVSSNATAR